MPWLDRPDSKAHSHQEGFICDLVGRHGRRKRAGTMKTPTRSTARLAAVSMLLAVLALPSVSAAEDARCPDVRAELDWRLNQQQELNQTGTLGSLTMDEAETTITNLESYIQAARDDMVRYGCSS
jgi:hypothetical protein